MAGPQRYYIGKALTRLLWEKHMTREDLAAASGISPGNIDRLATGRQGARASTLKPLAAPLGVAPKDLVQEQPDAARPKQSERRQRPAQNKEETYMPQQAEPPEGHISAQQAKKLLGVTDERVRQLVREGKLAGQMDESGSRLRYWVDLRAVHELRARREAKLRVRGTVGLDNSTLEPLDGKGQDLLSQLERERERSLEREREIGRLQGRLEMTEKALEIERERVQKLEAELASRL